MKRQCDLAVIGAGPAGATCAMQADRYGIDAVVIDPQLPGGLVRCAHRIDNLPGFPDGISGKIFARLLADQLIRCNVPVIAATADGVQRTETGFLIRAGENDLACRALLLATGTRPLPFYVPGYSYAAETGRAHRDIRSLPLELSDAEVVVVGSGEAAVDSALSAALRGGRVTVVCRGNMVRAQRMLIREAAEQRVQFAHGYSLAAVEHLGGGLALEWIGEEGTKRTVSDHLVVCIGREPRLSLYRALVSDGPNPQSIATPVPGLFLAGDVIRGAMRFVTTSAGDGMRAAELINRFLNDGVGSGNFT